MRKSLKNHIFYMQSDFDVSFVYFSKKYFVKIIVHKTFYETWYNH